MHPSDGQLDCIASGIDPAWFRARLFLPDGLHMGAMLGPTGQGLMLQALIRSVTNQVRTFGFSRLLPASLRLLWSTLWLITWPPALPDIYYYGYCMRLSSPFSSQKHTQPHKSINLTDNLWIKCMDFFYSRLQYLDLGTHDIEEVYGDAFRWNSCWSTISMTYHVWGTCWVRLPNWGVTPPSSTWYPRPSSLSLN